jgi:hypothetical protein
MRKTTNLPGHSWPGLGWLGAGVAVSALFALLVPDRHFLPAFADGLMIAGASLLAISWIMHLRLDGVRVLPPRAPKAPGSVSTWKDRMPEPGKAPPEPAPLPGPEGPESEAYLRLHEAESKLREKILGGDSVNDKNDKAQARKNAIGIALPGFILFVLSLVFQYIVPRL